MRLRFGDCVFDTGVRELKREGRAVQLPPKAFRLLEVLAERRPSAVSQDELRALLWPDTMMGGTTLARLVSDVRTAIGDDRSSEIIRTVHRFGYAFAAAASELSEGIERRPITRCAIQWGSRLVPLAPGKNVIGRSPEALISIPSPKVSRRHACLLVNGGAVSIEDLGSRNGTYVGGQKLKTRIDLENGDRIRIGPAMLIFYESGGDAPTATQTKAK